MRRRHKSHERGAAAVEFALIAAFIMLPLLAFTIQSALLFWGYQAASSAAREAARFGAVSPCDPGLIEARGDARVDEIAPVGGSSGFTDVTSATPTLVGDELTVRVSFSTLTIIPLPGWPGISKTATTRVENIPAGGC